MLVRRPGGRLSVYPARHVRPTGLPRGRRRRPQPLASLGRRFVSSTVSTVSPARSPKVTTWWSVNAAPGDWMA